MAEFYLKSGSGVTQFAQSTAYSSGDRIVPLIADTGSNYAVARRWVWECTTAGTTAAANPTWPGGVAQDVTTVTSGTAVFTARKPGFSSGTTADWTFATIFYEYLVGAVAAADTVYVSDAHSESYGAAITTGPVCLAVVCVDDATAPPTAISTGAVVATAGEFAMSAIGNGGAFIYGIEFQCGVGATGTRSLTLSAKKLERCNFILSTTGASSTIASSSANQEFINCGVRFSAAGQLFSAPVIRGGSLLSGGTSPTAMFNCSSNAIDLIGFDLSNASAGVNICSGGSGTVSNFSGVKLPASWSGVITSSTLPNAGERNLHAVGETGTALIQRSSQLRGTVAEETTVVKSGGFTHAGTSASSKMVAASTASFPAYSLNSLPFAAYNSTTGSAVTVTVDILSDSATNLTDKEVFLEVSYFSDSGSPLMTLASSAPSFMASASDLAASTATWTTTGLTNPNAQKLTVTFTPQLAGMVIGRVKLCKASKTVYVDPVLQLS